MIGINLNPKVDHLESACPNFPSPRINGILKVLAAGVGDELLPMITFVKPH